MSRDVEVPHLSAISIRCLTAGEQGTRPFELITGPPERHDDKLDYLSIDLMWTRRAVGRSPTCSQTTTEGTRSSQPQPLLQQTASLAEIPTESRL